MRFTHRLHGLAIAVALAAPAAKAQEIAPRTITRAFANQVRTGDFEAALVRVADLPGSVAERAVVRGMVLERLGRWQPAADAYATTGSGPLPAGLREHARYLQARALARAGRCRGALPLLRAFPETSPPADPRVPEVQALEAECLRELARENPTYREAARAALQALLDDVPAGQDGFALALALADLRWQSGEREVAQESLRALLVSQPSHPDALEAAGQLKGWLGVARLTWTAREQLTRASHWMSQRRYEQALEALSHIEREHFVAGGASEEQATGLWQTLLHVRGTALFRTRRRYVEAASALEMSAAAGGRHAADDSFMAARAHLRAGAMSTAVEAFRRFAQQYRPHPRGREARYLAGWVALRHAPPEGRRALAAFIARGPRRHRLVRSAALELGFDALQRGAADEAARRFAEARGAPRGRPLDPHPHADPMVWGRSVYWEAAAERAAGDHERAVALFRVVATSHPLHWYGLWSRLRLAELGARLPALGRVAAAGEQPALIEPAAVSSADLATQGLPEAVLFLQRHGFDGTALGWLRRHNRSLLQTVTDHPERIGALQRLGMYTEPYRRVLARSRRLLAGRAPMGVARERMLWQAVCPRAFGDAVAVASVSERVPKSLLWAVMRQESRFDPHALSYADAMGLMQLLPSTAARMAGSDAGAPFSHESLFLPAVNIRLGARYLRQLRDRFPLPLAVAAYNAGESRVDGWRARFGEEVPLDLFVEKIPVTQTRNYVRRVLSHLACYADLYGFVAGFEGSPFERLFLQPGVAQEVAVP